MSRYTDSTAAGVVKNDVSSSRKATFTSGDLGVDRFELGRNQVPREARHGPLARATAHLADARRVAEERENRRRKRARVAPLDDESALTFEHRLGQAACVRYDDGNARGLCF